MTRIPPSRRHNSPRLELPRARSMISFRNHGIGIPSAVKIKRLMPDTTQSPQYGLMKPSNLVKPFMSPRLYLVPYFLRYVAYFTARSKKNNRFFCSGVFKITSGIILTAGKE